MAPLPVQYTIDATNHLFWTLSGRRSYEAAVGHGETKDSSRRAGLPYLDLHKIDGLHEPGLGSQHTGIEAAPGSGDDLATPTVDGIGMQRHIMDIKAYTPHVLLTQCPLQGKGTKATI